MATIQKYKTATGHPRWRVRYRLNGKQKSKSFNMHKKANNFKIKLEHGTKEGSYIEPTKTTVSELLDNWIAVHSKAIEMNSIRGYNDGIKVVKQYIGGIYINRLTAADVEGMFSKYGEGRSGRSVLSLYQVLNMALKYAIKSRLINFNVCDAVDRPKKEKPTIDIIDGEDIEKYMNVVKDTWCAPAVALAMFAGMRRGEIFALGWDHVDFDKAEIFVEFAHVVEKNKAGYTFDEKTPKNGTTRTIPIPQNIVGLLKQHKKTQAQQRLSMGSLYHTECQYSGKNNNFVLTMPDGKRPYPGYIYTFFTRRVKSANIQPVSFHSLKHTAASLLYKSGIDYKQMSYILGHASVQFTIDTYVHLFKDELHLSKDKISAHMSQFFKS